MFLCYTILLLRVSIAIVFIIKNSTEIGYVQSKSLEQNAVFIYTIHIRNITICTNIRYIHWGSHGCDRMVVGFTTSYGNQCLSTLML